MYHGENGLYFDYECQESQSEDVSQELPKHILQEKELQQINMNVMEEN